MLMYDFTIYAMRHVEYEPQLYFGLFKGFHFYTKSLWYDTFIMQWFLAFMWCDMYNDYVYVSDNKQHKALNLFSLNCIVQ